MEYSGHKTQVSDNRVLTLTTSCEVLGVVCCSTPAAAVIIMANLSEEDKRMLELGKAFAALGASADMNAEAADDWVRERGRRLLPEKDSQEEDAVKLPEGKAKQPLLNMVAPRLPVCSCSNDKTEVSFNLYRYEVKCLLAENEPVMVMQAIRRSLRGQAAEVLLHLGEKATVEQLLSKLELVFGDVLTSEAILEAFYAAKQKPKEPAALWGCRLEGLLEQARRKGAVDSKQGEDMLRTKFWSGLTDAEVKAALRHSVDSQKSYGELFKQARGVEEEKASRNIEARTYAVQDPVLTELREISKKMANIETRLNALEVEKAGQQERRSSRQCFGCGEIGHFRRDCQRSAGNAVGPTLGGPQ